MTVFIALGFAILLLLVGLLWILVTAFYGPPSVPTRVGRIRKALELAKLKEGEVLYDLGSGDGRVLIVAAQEFRAQAVGIEIGPVQRAFSWLKALRSGVRHKVRIEAGDYFKADLRAANVVFVYATSREVAKLAAHLPNAMQPGARLISISADFPEWEPAVFDEEDLIFIYSMPPVHGSLTTHLLKRTP